MEIRREHLPAEDQSGSDRPSRLARNPPRTASPRHVVPHVIHPKAMRVLNGFQRFTNPPSAALRAHSPRVGEKAGANGRCAAIRTHLGSSPGEFPAGTTKPQPRGEQLAPRTNESATRTNQFRSRRIKFLTHTTEFSARTAWLRPGTTGCRPGRVKSAALSHGHRVRRCLVSIICDSESRESGDGSRKLAPRPSTLVPRLPPLTTCLRPTTP